MSLLAAHSGDTEAKDGFRTAQIRTKGRFPPQTTRSRPPTTTPALQMETSTLSTFLLQKHARRTVIEWPLEILTVLRAFDLLTVARRHGWSQIGAHKEP